MRQTLVALIGSVLLLGTGCTAGTEPKDVSANTVEKKVSDTLAKKVGQTPDDVSCPKDLPAEKGSTIRCVLTAGSDKIGVTVTTKSVSDAGKVNFGIKVDDKVMN